MSGIFFSRFYFPFEFPPMVCGRSSPLSVAGITMPLIRPIMMPNPSTAAYSCSSRPPRDQGRVLVLAAVLSYIGLLAGLAAMAAAGYLAVRWRLRAPLSDMWSIIDFWAHPTQSTIHWLWAQHNEHRILLPKLILLLDYRFFGGREAFALATGFAAQLALLAALLWALRAMAGMRGALWRSAAAVAAFCLFSTAQWANFMGGFEVSFFFVGLFVTLGILALLSSRRAAKGDWKYAAAAVLAGTAATYSMAHGILVWPILLVVAILHGCRKRIVALLVTSGAAIAGSYLYHYASPLPQVSPLHSLHHPLLVVAYVIKYIGAPLDWGHPALAAVFGVVGLASAAWALKVAVRDRHPVVLLFAALPLFVILSAAMTALGRLYLGADQALSSRYETVALLLWLSLAVLLLRFVSRRSAALLVAVQIGLLVALAVGAPRLRLHVAIARAAKLQADTASLALLTGVFDQSALASLFPVPAVPWRDLPFLKRNHLSLFSSWLARDLNQPLSAACSLRPPPVWGDLTTLQAVTSPAGPGLRVSGWVWDPLRSRAGSQLVFVAGGRIVGYAEIGFSRLDLGKRLGKRSAADAGWVGYIEAVPQNTTVSAYAADRASGAESCALLNRPSSPLGVAGEPLRFSIGPAAK